MGMKVLVADDSGVMRKIIIRGLTSLGVTETVEACDGNEAIKHFQEQAFDMVLTDWNMPGKTCIEVLKEIRASGATIPVVLITTETEKRRVMDAIQAGVSEYVIKPFDAASLQAKLGKFIDAAQV
jgi:two-component system chemotaxis response regulator CheY